MKQIIFIFLLFPAILSGQPIVFEQRTEPDFKSVQPVAKQRTGINFKTLILPSALSFCSGATWGLHEKTMHHWGEFHARFPNANPQFWNPEISWRNKYVDGNPELGRNRKFIYTSDAKHLLASSNQVLAFGAGCTIFIGRKVSWKEYAFRFLASGIGYTAGNYVTFNALYK